MAEFRRPGVFVKEVVSIPPPPLASPSALGLVGFTLKGPANRAVRVESFEDFRDIFGGFTPLSLLPLTLEKYFNNGGQFAWIVRVTPVGSRKAENRFTADTVYANGVGIGNGVQTLFTGIIPNAPLARAKIEATLPGDGTAGPYVFTIAGGFDPHTIGIEAGAQFAIDDPGIFPAGTFIGDVAASAINYTTGVCSITFTAPVPLGTDVIVRRTSTQIRALTGAGGLLFAFDDGNNGLIGEVNPIGPNTINYLTGEFDVNFNAAPDGTAVVRLQNDAFGAAGNVAITETVTDPGFVVTGMAGGTDYAPAVGTITAVAGALLVDGETFTLNDGVNPPVVFEFDSGGGVSAGNIPVPFTAGDSAVTVAHAIRAAINGAVGLNITAEPVFAYATRNRWLFTAQAEGVFGNNIRVAIEGSDNFRKNERIGEFSSASFLDIGTGAAGPYTFVIPNAPLVPRTITIVAGNQVVYDDGNGTLIGDAAAGSTVDYTDGAVSVTFNAAIPVGAGIRVHIDGFQFFDVSISEFDPDIKEFIVKEFFEALEMTDQDSSDFLTTVVNDPVQGSRLIQAITGQAGVLPTLIRTSFKQQIDTGGFGPSPVNGTNRRFTGKLSNTPIDPFSVKVYVDTAADVFDGQEVLDNGVGFLVGPNIDPFGVNQINYEDGTIDVTFKIPPALTEKVRVAYIQQRTRDSVQFEGGSDGTGVITRSQIAVPGLEPNKQGVYAFNVVEDALHIAVPDFAGNADVLNDLINFAETKKDRFIIGTTANNLTPAEAVNYRRSQIRSNSSFCAVYYPWVRALDRSINRTRTIPPLGHVAGVYSRTDRARSEGKAPAGIVDGLLLDVVGLERVLENQDVELIFPVNLNSIVQATAIGIYVNGARTLSSDVNFKYVNVRRVFIAIRKKAENSLRFALFEPIGPALFSRISATLTSIALEFFQKGALAGSTPNEAFLVEVDNLNTPELADQGIVKARLAIAPTKPAEFIVVELTVKQRESTVIAT